MENFTKAFLRVKQPSEKEISAKKSLDPIHVALIDDGVDTTNGWPQGKAYRGRSFAFDHAGGRNYPYWISESGHGTIMARFIRKLCPSDQGKTGNDATYPYDANQANIIRIGAATAAGNLAEYVNKCQVDFLFPGHEILLKGSTPDQELGDVHKGSSVATAIAAGLAATVLECILIGHFWASTKLDNPQKSITEQDLMMMDSKAMKAAFEGMSRSRSSYIWVWETFTPAVCERIIDGGREDQLAAVTKLAKGFLPKDL